jgi:hypothetical protein
MTAFPPPLATQAAWRVSAPVCLMFRLWLVALPSPSLPERKFLLLVMGSTLDNSKIYLRKRFSNVTHNNIHQQPKPWTN